MFWTVLGPYIETPAGERKYLCRCDCGTERYVLERSLRYVGSKSCSCLKITYAIEKKEHKLSDMVFGDLRVMQKAEKKHRNGGTWWICQCSCGNMIEVPGTLLVTKRKTHCGCKSNPQYHTADIKGKTFHRLTAQYPLRERDSKGNVIWHCICQCGNEVNISYNTLMYTDIRSCGCWKRERESNLGDLIARVDGTSIDLIKSNKIPSNNTSGVKGVYYQKGKWLAKIVFQKKQYHLGQYDNIESAKKAREEAERILFAGTAAHYEKWKERAVADPEWAEENQIKIQVSKVNTTELSIVFLPEI